MARQSQATLTSSVGTGYEAICRHASRFRGTAAPYSDTECMAVRHNEHAHREHLGPQRPGCLSAHRTDSSRERMARSIPETPYWDRRSPRSVRRPVPSGSLCGASTLASWVDALGCQDPGESGSRAQPAARAQRGANGTLQSRRDGRAKYLPKRHSRQDLARDRRWPLCDRGMVRLAWLGRPREHGPSGRPCTGD
jgi:hypothetical protein